MVISSCHEYCDICDSLLPPTIKDKVNYQDREKVETRPYGLIKCFAEKGVSFSYKSTFSSIFRTEDTQKNLLSDKILLRIVWFRLLYY